MGSVDRCIHSALSHLLGLYEFGSGYNLPDGIPADLLQPPFETNADEINFKNLKYEDIVEIQNSNAALDLGFMPVPLRDSKPFFPDCP